MFADVVGILAIGLLCVAWALAMGWIPIALATPRLMGPGLFSVAVASAVLAVVPVMLRAYVDRTPNLPHGDSFGAVLLAAAAYQHLLLLWILAGIALTVGLARLILQRHFT